MPKKRPVRVKKTALVVVGEGAHDKAFINHMKSIYFNRQGGYKLTADSADGGSPFDIINSVIRKSRHTAFDKTFILMDNDKPPTQQEFDLARKAKIEIILSTPHCLEGMLLDVLGQKPATNSQACKAQLHPQLSGKPTEPSSYSQLFPKDILDNTAKIEIVKLKSVISQGG